MHKLIAAVALATVLASPAFAQSYDPDVGTGNIAPPIEATASPSGARDASGGARGQSPYTAYGAVTPFASPAHAATAARATAIRECSALAAPYREMTWGSMGTHQYRTCMAQHGQAE